MKIGLVGLPNAGKSTLFNALIKRRLAKVANRPFTTIDPNVGVIDVPDERLEQLADILKPPRVIPTTLKVIDIAGLVKDAHKGVGLGNQFLAHIREVDLIVYVVRAFEDPSVVHPANKIDPKGDLEILQLELELADVDKSDRQSSWSAGSAERDPVGMTSKLIDKPSLVVVNVSENQLKSDHHQTLDLLQLSTVGGEVLLICAKTEMELADLTPPEQKEYLKTLSLRKSGLDRLLKMAYKKLGLITFYTFNDKELRAWPIKEGTTATEAAGKIHTDLQHGFIAAEVIAWDKLIEAGGWKLAKEQGWVRLEGKEYLMQNGDVILVRFNV